MEGIDGSGKTTVSRKLKSLLTEKGYKVFLTEEPTGSLKVDPVLAEKRDAESAYKLLMSFTEDRIKHSRIIKEKLDAGEIVISDRYFLSSAAYQGVLLKDLYSSNTELLNFLLTLSSPIEAWPDIVILLDIDPDLSLERIKARSDISKFEDSRYLKKVRDFYLALSEILSSRVPRYNVQSGSDHDTVRPFWNNLKKIEIIDSSIRRKYLLSRCVSAVEDML